MSIIKITSLTLFLQLIFSVKFIIFAEIYQNKQTTNFQPCQWCVPPESLICSNISPPNRYKWHSINRTQTTAGSPPPPAGIRDSTTDAPQTVEFRLWNKSTRHLVCVKGWSGRAKACVTQEFHVWVLGYVGVCDMAAWVEEDAEANNTAV